MPGIRPNLSLSNDQKRTAGPADTVSAGADILVIGRPITRSDDPIGAARRIAEEIGDAIA